ncbi:MULTISPECIES: chemotaxis protein CheC [Arthrospira]|jgi:chemotaxis protein CheC|uniref:CheC-like protein n=1 Tax=Limnospira platensis NIES-46 TaxID=1236695 RepID=A0A5M3T907_LIMPL|nr:MULTISPECIES: chemotaxis protein CheC [Arthrospira]AMW28450.1 chemotaxis protein CheC [Arthrospira platensis YZ]KDR56391.1 chemotaxis protein CheC [Arthrospira platensis str. Paraca]MBD2670569.1 chemotaxis protein CheC [Arthrospira platensis FACHB-439]MBD2711253.1 chemotaxis protein CheC [Arthrospira platensis FACHB-835]MDF2209652.1 chemotaxis protein CheC [Arthrospira platensis NCB002]MDT9183638.1 chemotaxis protein CheC [Limnospira sp. PMC 289.06]MDT9294210.1 chemotaxis protein CheC [Ar
MILTEKQKDALTELINIGFARTANSLSQLTGHRILLDVPQVSIHPIEELAGKLASFVNGEIATVQQIFTGPVSGNALLLLNYEGAVMLSRLVSPEGSPSSDRLDVPAGEVLTEIGNILLNSCLSVFGNLLEIQISFSVPRLYLEALDGLIHSLIIGKEEVSYAMVMYTSFKMREDSVNGYLVLILGVVSLEKLLELIDSWADEAVTPSLTR